MNISSTAVRPQARIAAKKAEQQAPPQEQEQQTQPQPPADDKVTWGGALTGLATGVVSGVVGGVGIGVSSVPQAIRGTVEGYKALYKNETIGPWLKMAIGAVLPVATVATPVLGAIVGAGAGLITGFTEGVEEGMKAGLSAGTELVRDFNKEMMPDFIESVRDFGNEKLEEGEEKFDISPIKGAGAAAAGVLNTAVGAVGFGGATLLNIPRAFINGNKEIAKSDIGAPLKVVTHAVSLPLVPIAAGLGPVGGAVAGLVSGTVHGYKDGFVESFKKTGEYIVDYNKFLRNAFD